MKQATAKTDTKNTFERERAQGSLRDALGAVSLAIATMPVVEKPRGAGEAFLRVDHGLSMLQKEIATARANLAKIVAMAGTGDPMAEALLTQISALEQAYAERLALLKRKREESTRKASVAKQIWAEDKTVQDVRLQRDVRRRNNGALWLLAYLILRGQKTSALRFGHVPKAA